MKLPRRQFLHLTAVAVALPAVSCFAWAQAHPSRLVRLIVGFPPGGGADTTARIIGPWLSQRLGQPVVIENRPGASSTLAAQAVVNSPPDGYTLLLLGGSALMATLITSVPFDLQRDLAPVSGLTDNPMVLVAHPSVQAKTVAELIALAKAKPGTISMGWFGTGSASHLAGELFKMMADVNLLHVPYRGGAPMITDLVGGQVQVAFDVMVTSPRTSAPAACACSRWQAASDPTYCRRCRPSPRRCRDTRRGPGRGLRARRHASGDHRTAQPRDQCRPGYRGHQGAAEKCRRHPDDFQLRWSSALSLQPKPRSGAR